MKGVICALALSLLLTLTVGTESLETKFDLGIANRYWYYFSATLCDFSRLQNWDVGVISQTYPNLTEIEIIHNNTGEAMAYVAYDPSENSIYAIFRGTISNIQNWIDDGDIIMRDYPECSGCMVHQGFYFHYLDLKDGILNKLQIMREAHPSAAIIIIGHSMGATGATLLAIDVRKVFGSFDSIFTYGSPRVGNQAFVDWWNSQIRDIFNVRLTHKHDPGKRFI